MRGREEEYEEAMEEERGRESSSSTDRWGREVTSAGCRGPFCEEREVVRLMYDRQASTASASSRRRASARAS